MNQKLSIVKIGGNVINDPELLSSFLTDFSRLEGLKILVHGGGKKATERADIMGLEPRIIGGRRVTDRDNLEVVVMVYAGWLNKNIVAGLQALGCNALGLSGADANLIKAHKRIVKDIDYGFAGDVDHIDKDALSLLLHHGMVPVFSAITHDTKGQLLNTNADTIAAELAKGLCVNFEVSLIYCFEKKGVLEKVDDENSVIEIIDRKEYASLKKNGIIAQGMLPKMENCFEALTSGVRQVHIGKPGVIADMSQTHTTLVL